MTVTCVLLGHKWTDISNPDNQLRWRVCCRGQCVAVHPEDQASNKIALMHMMSQWKTQREKVPVQDGGK